MEAVFSFIEDSSVEELLKVYREEGINFAGGDGLASKLIQLQEFQIYIENFERDIIEHPDWPKHTTPVQDIENFSDKLNRILEELPGMN